MDIDSVRAYCLSFPNASEDVQWGSDLLFRISGKMFAVMNLEPPHQLAFKCTPEKLDEVIEVDEIIEAPYMARNKLVRLERPNSLGDSEIKSLIKSSYEMVLAKLPKKTQAALGAA